MRALAVDWFVCAYTKKLMLMDFPYYWCVFHLSTLSFIWALQALQQYKTQWVKIPNTVLCNTVPAIWAYCKTITHQLSNPWTLTRQTKLGVREIKIHYLCCLKPNSTNITVTQHQKNLRGHKWLSIILLNQHHSRRVKMPEKGIEAFLIVDLISPEANIQLSSLNRQLKRVIVSDYTI